MGMNLKEFLAKESNLTEQNVKKISEAKPEDSDIEQQKLVKEDVKQEIIHEQVVDTKTPEEKAKPEVNIEKLFVESETSEEFKDKWMEIYEKAKKSRKKNYITDKILRGRFTIRGEEQKPIILSDVVTYNKSSKDIIKELGG